MALLASVPREDAQLSLRDPLIAFDNPSPEMNR